MFEKIWFGIACLGFIFTFINVVKSELSWLDKLVIGVSFTSTVLFWIK